MRTGLLFAAATAVVLSLSWGGGARAAVSAPSPPSHDGVLVVHFGRSLPEKELGEFLTTFMVDLNRVTARLPVFDVNAAIFQSCFTYETVVYVYYDVRGSEAAFLAQTDHLVRAVAALPDVKSVVPVGGSLPHYAGEPCLQSFAPTWTEAASAGTAAAGAATEAEQSRPDVGQAPARPTAVSISPSPSRGGVPFDFAVSAPGGESSVEVFDVSGRRVAEVFRGPRAPGAWTARWRGTDAQGRRVPQGTYFVLVRSGGRATSARFVVTP